MKRSERLQKKRERAELAGKMRQIVDELNSLRDEAAEKMYDVPKGYRLITVRDELRSCFIRAVVAMCAVGFLAVFMWALSGESAVQLTLAIICLVVLSVGSLWASAAKSRPYKILQGIFDCYVNDLYYGVVVKELDRLKAGIADYNRQYEEQKEYIQKFQELSTEVEDFGSMKFILKANNFHAHIEMRTTLDDLDCRIDFNETGYNQLKDVIDFFNNRVA